MLTDVSEVRTASIIRVMNTPKMEAVRTSETSVSTYLTTQQYIPEYYKLHTRRRKNLKSHKAKAVPLHATEDLEGGRRYNSYSFSTSALHGGQWSASHYGRALVPGKGPPGTHCTGGWVGPRAGLDTRG
jgi:hypothetical protein